MADDFFETKLEEKPVEPEADPEPEKVKVGEKEYTQEELTRKVGLAEIAEEADQKYNVKTENIWPKFQQTINEKKALEERITELETKQVATKAEAGQELTPEEQIKQVRGELRKFGGVTEDNINDFIDNRLAARDLQDDVQAVIELAKEEGKPAVSEEDLVEHMSQTGIRNPQKAYNDKFEPEIDKWKQSKLDSVKKPGMVTEDTSTAGSKEPPKVELTRDNLKKHLDEVLFRDM